MMGKPQTLQTPNKDDIRTLVSTLLERAGVDGIVEIRAPGSRQGTFSGYYDDVEAVVRDAARISGTVPSVYVTLNKVHPDLRARAYNHLKPHAKHATSDGDILRRHWLPIDVDPLRPSGVSSTDDEHDAAIKCIRKIRAFLRKLGFAECVVGDSGNGAHLLYPIDLPNTSDSTQLLERCLAALDLQFSNDGVTIDRTTCNAAQIWKLYGTLAAKGDNIPERSHRLARILHYPSRIEVAPVEVLEKLAAMALVQPLRSTKNRSQNGHDTPGEFDLDAWLRRHDLSIANTGSWNGGRKWVLSQCPWNESHTNRSAYVVRLPNGAISAGCHHNSCQGKGWKELRALYEAEEIEAIPQASTPTAPTVDLLDTAPATISKPLTLVDGHAYSATWLHARVTQSESTKGKRTIQHDPPLVYTEQRLVVVRDDGQVFADGTLRGVSMKSISELSLDIHLPEVPRPDKLWSAHGVKQYLAGMRPDPADVFRRVTEVLDTFIDFDRSFADQRTICEFLTCYTLSTWFLDGFNVAGFLWPNGERGSGKTQTIMLIAEMAYLGQVILGGSTYASLRDLADYGAFLAFDDAENLADPKRTDPDKRALLLAGNRRGNTVPVKEPTGNRGWRTRYVNTYCPRAFTAICLPDQVLASRTIVVPLIRTADRARANSDPLDYQAWPHDRQALLDDLWALALAHLPSMPKYDRFVAAKSQLQGRNLEPWRAVLAVARFLDEVGVDGLWDRIEGLSLAYQRERANVEVGDLTVGLLHALCKLVAKTCDISDINSGKKMILPTAKITEAITDAIHTNELDVSLEFVTSRRVGRLMAQLRFKDKREGGTGKRMWEFTPAEVKSLAERYAVLAPPDDDVCDTAITDVNPELNVTDVIDVTMMVPESEPPYACPAKASGWCADCVDPCFASHSAQERRGPINPKLRAWP